MQGIKSMLARRTALLIAVTAVGVLGSAGVASAATYTVSDTSDAPLANPADTNCVSTQGGTCTLRAAVQASDNSGGANTITVPSGTYTLSIAPASTGDADNPATGDLNIINNAKTTINGAGSGSTIIDANHVDRAFAVQSGSSLALSAATVTNGTAVTYEGNSTAGYQCSASWYSPEDCGGAIYSAGSLTLAGDAVLKNNSAQYGGGVYWTCQCQKTAEPLTIKNSTLTNNTAAYQGGALDSWGYSLMTATGSTFTGNTAGDDGGAVYDYESAASNYIADRFTGNSTTNPGSSGGALYLDANSGYTVAHDEIDNNSSAGDGGAIYWSYGELRLDGTSVLSNTAATNGGAIYAYAGTPLKAQNLTLAKNSAASGGGIYFNETSPTDLINSTVFDNTATTAGQGGGIYGTSSPSPYNVGVENTIIARNTGGDCADSGATSQFSALMDAGYNLDGDGSCFRGTGAPGDKVGVDPLLGQPTYNGGPVLTDAELSGSPAIDAGTDANCPATDARGVARPQGASCDIGAFESTVGNGRLSLSKTGPATATKGDQFTYKLSVGNKGPGPSTNTTVVDQLPANAKLVSVNQSQGSCSETGSPAKVSCNLGTLASGGGATVSISVSVSKLGTVTNTASASDDQGSSVSSSATTKVGYLGALVLDRTRLHVRHGRVYVPFTCKSARTCTFRFTIIIHARVKKTHKIATLEFTTARNKLKTIRAHRRVMESTRVNKAALRLLQKARHHRLTGRLTTRPRTNQKGIIKVVRLIQG